MTTFHSPIGTELPAVRTQRPATGAGTTGSPWIGASPRPALHRGIVGAMLVGCGAMLAACGGGGGSGSSQVTDEAGTSLSVGQGPVYPSTTPALDPTGYPADFSYPDGYPFSPAGFFVAESEGGSQSDPKLLSILWGRLVDIVVQDSVTGDDELLYRDYLIGEDIRTDGEDYVLESNPITESVTLRILHQPGTPEYKIAFARLDDNLGPVLSKHPQDAPPYSFLPRNCAAVLIFSDLLDPETVSNETVRVRVGSPPISPYEARTFPDPNFGALVNGPNGKEFRSTRILVDMTISLVESQGTSLAVNSLGLPPSSTTAVPNVAIRIPTKQSPAMGVFALLKNVSGHPLTLIDDGPIDIQVASQEVVRAMRSGGDPLLTGDGNNGFLLDLNPPRIVGSQAVTVLSVLPEPSPETYELTLKFAYQVCQQVASKGDVLEFAGVFAEVLSPSTAAIGGVISGVRVRVLLDQGAATSPILPGAQGLFSSAFEPGDLPACFVSFSPDPKLPPNARVAPSSQVTLQFSEPMDPQSVNAFDTFVIGRESGEVGGEGINDIVVGQINISPDLREFRFVPLMPFAHAETVEDEYFIRVAEGTAGPTDLAGNGLQTSLDEIPFLIDPAAESEFNGGIVLRFSSTDEDGVVGAEITGQFLLDSEREVLQPRPVTRFPAVADRTQAVPSIMIPFPAGVQTPLTSLGSRMMTLWRYFDVGFSATDIQNHNVDIEGLAWSPIGGQLIFDTYDEFEISLSHSKLSPDEVINPTSLLPTYPNSGLNAQAWQNNVLDDPLNSLMVVHPRSKGYEVNPIDLFTSTTGTKMMPYPLNRTGDPQDFTYFTWRDWRVRAVAGCCNAGIDPAILVSVGLAQEAGQIAYQNFIPSYGLPLLMEFKCYPDDHAVGLNSFDISIAINSSSKPQFRVFSSGGYNTSQSPVIKNPDSEVKPSGGFNPTSNPPGNKTPAMDNVFYIGQMDIVTRVSIVYTRFLNADDDPSPDYLTPTIEPIAEDQPLGTQLLLSYRGASSMQDNGDGAAQIDAGVLDEYGDKGDNNGSGLPGDPGQKNNGITFYPDPFDKTWAHDIDDVDGARFLQIRFTFISNVISNLSPEISAIGVAFGKTGL